MVMDVLGADMESIANSLLEHEPHSICQHKLKGYENDLAMQALFDLFVSGWLCC